MNADRMPLRRSSARRPGRRGLLGVLGIGAIAVGLVACSSGPTPPKRTPVATPAGVTSASPKPKPTPKPTPTATPAVAAFDKTANSVDDPASIWVVANKSRPLDPAGYAPTDLVYPAVEYVNR